MAKLTYIRDIIEESVKSDREDQKISKLEKIGIDADTAKELVHIGSGMSGATLAAMWASIGMATTAASVKGVLLAAGVVHPATLLVVGTGAAVALAALTTYAGGKMAYTAAKDATRGVFNPPQSKRDMSNLMSIIAKRDKALTASDGVKVAKYTEQMLKKSQQLHDNAYKDLQKNKITKQTYQSYIRVSEKGLLGQLSALV